MVAGCSSGPIREVSVLNLTQENIVINDGRTRSTDIGPRRSFERWTLKGDNPLKIESDGKTLEEYTAEDLGFPQDGDARVLLIVGEPRFLVLADYTEFYTKQGETPIKDPKIKLVANLRGKKICPLERYDKITWPGISLAKTKYTGGGFRNKRFLRMVELPEETEDESILDYLNEELRTRPPK